MKNLKKHWQPIAVILMVLILAGTFWIRNGGPKTVLAQGGGYDPADQAERQAVTRLLEEISLDRNGLIALNLSDSQAESLLATARTWRSDNAATLQTGRNTIAEEVEDVRQIKRAIRMGPWQQGRDQQLNTANQDLADAEAAYRTTLADLEGDIEEILSASQKDTWTVIKRGFSRKMPLRMLDLTADQRRALSRAERHYKWRQGAARTDQERDAAVSARHTAWDQILTEAQENVIDAYHGYHEASSGRVAEAFETVFPPA